MPSRSPSARPTRSTAAHVAADNGSSVSARWISAAVQPGNATLSEACRYPPPASRAWIASPGARTDLFRGTSTQISGNPHCWYLPSFQRRTSVVWSTSSTTSGSGPVSTFTRPRAFHCAGRRYTTLSACRIWRGRAAASRRARLVEPKHSLTVPRTDAIRAVSMASRCPGCSCQEETSRTRQAFPMRASQYSMRSS